MSDNDKNIKRFYYYLQKIDSNELTETKIAKLFTLFIKNKVLYCAKEKSWYIWNGKKWEVDYKKEIINIVQSIIRKMQEYSIKMENTKKKQQITPIFLKYENYKYMKNLIELLKPEFPVLPEEFNSNPYLLNLQNGTLDLQTLKLLPHNPENKISKITNVKYNKDTICKLWEETLDKYFLGRKEIIEYFQKALGLSLVGKQLEHIFFLLHGRGSNGKTTILNVLREIMGDYCGEVNVDTFLSSKYENNRFSTYQVVGKRFIFCIEPDKHKYLNEGTVKALTGGDSILIEKKYCMPYEIKPQGTIFLACNNLPVIRGSDHGIWRRMKEIPFDYKITNEEKINNFEEILLKEKNGIFLWILIGWKEYKEKKLCEPEILKRINEEYKNNENPITDFCNEFCIIDESQAIQARPLYNHYLKWCESVNEKRPLSEKKFSQFLKDKGFEKDTCKGLKFWYGIGIKKEGEEG